jgi:Fic family protein
MKSFDYARHCARLLSPKIMEEVLLIHEYRSRQEFYVSTSADSLEALRKAATGHSADVSNRMEGIIASPERLTAIVEALDDPRNPDEEMIAGYRDVVTDIQANYDDIDFTPDSILRLHRDLFAYASVAFGGVWKEQDNVIVASNTSGEQIIRFRPLAAEETPRAMELLCRSFSEEMVMGVYDPLLLIPMCIFDFMCIHPFADGNGRMSRLLTTLLYGQSGYPVGKYVSLEALIGSREEAYHDALSASAVGWQSDTNDYAPFVLYLLRTVSLAYQEFFDQVGSSTDA